MHNDQIHFSYAAIALGALALFLALAHTFAGPFAPSPSIGTTLGEIAGDIRAAAARAVSGSPQPEPVTASWNIDRVIVVLVPAMAVLGIVSGIVGLLRDEPRKAAVGGIVLGISAVLAQVLFWLAMLICAVVLIASVMNNLEAILD